MSIDWDSEETARLISDSLEAMLAVKKLKVDHGRMRCPHCQGRHRLRFAVAPNGHTRGQCVTDNCLSWIE